MGYCFQCGIKITPENKATAAVEYDGRVSFPEGKFCKAHWYTEPPKEGEERPDLTPHCPECGDSLLIEGSVMGCASCLKDIGFLENT